MKTGFTRHEAVLYLTLCKEGGMTGYEAAKSSGIPRSNAYLGLAGLVDKGGAVKVEGDSSKYSAVPPEELVFNLRSKMEGFYSYIIANTPVREEANEPYFTITGRENIIGKMKYLITNATERIYVSTGTTELALVDAEVKRACAKGLKVVVITDKKIGLEGATVYKNEKQPGQIRLIADSAHVLTGELLQSDTSNCLYSKNKNLIQLIKEALKNEIRLIEISNCNMTST